MNDGIILEICIDSVESALAAERGGAHRVELCGDLLEGGITPSIGLTSMVRSRVSIDVYMMIRPRGGDFCYTGEELEIMDRDVRAGKEAGVDGFVFGVLREDGTVDTERTRRLVELARPKKVTFHRAFDMTRDLDEALDDVVAAGADRLLTSGGEQRAEQGTGTIAKLVNAAKQRIVVMAGSGISKSNVQRLIAGTGVQEIHASLRAPVDGPMRFRRESIAMGAVRGREYERRFVQQGDVRSLLEAAIQAPRGRNQVEPTA